MSSEMLLRCEFVLKQVSCIDGATFVAVAVACVRLLSIIIVRVCTVGIYSRTMKRGYLSNIPARFYFKACHD